MALQQGCGPGFCAGELRPCFMSGVTLTEDKREMVVIRNKVLVTFEASFDIHPLSVSRLSSFPSRRLAALLYTSASFRLSD